MQLLISTTHIACRMDVVALAWRSRHSCSTEAAAWSSRSSVKGLGLGLCYPCQYLVVNCSDEGSFAILGAAACVLDSKWHPKPVIPGSGIQIDMSSASNMLGMESSSGPFSRGSSGAKSRSLMCNRARALHNSAPDMFGHSERVQF